ncbi:uncharacterized protein LOC128228414 [Mya arenaria]|uniref:uncharacterized protein LOC128228414 n=1 Tax=Mya arenaria TaxID=6604 RepID=UPI0022E6118C|nr:uncharacterized protein LOC128228414 [Mya arenaria]
MSTASDVGKQDWVNCLYYSVSGTSITIQCQYACCEHACCTKQEADEMAAKDKLASWQIALVVVIPVVFGLLLYALTSFFQRRRMKRIRTALNAELQRKIIAGALAHARVNARMNNLAAERMARESRGPQPPEDTMLDPPYDGSLAESGLPTRREDPSDIKQSHCYRNPIDDFDKLNFN